jgi:hypothetical protein
MRIVNSDPPIKAGIKGSKYGDPRRLHFSQKKALEKSGTISCSVPGGVLARDDNPSRGFAGAKKRAKNVSLVNLPPKVPTIELAPPLPAYTLTPLL